MQFTLPRQHILQAVQRCQSIVERRHTVPIMANILLEAADQRLRITANDLEVGIRTSVPATIMEPGSITVSARKLFDILKELDNEAEVEATIDDVFMHIKSGRSKFRLATLPADDFPAIQEDADCTGVSLEGNDLAGMIGATAFAMSSDETRKYLTGTLFELDQKGSLNLIATDGHRLGMTGTPLGKSVEPTQVIVPRKAVMEIRKLCEEVGGEVELCLGERQVRLTAGDHCLTSKLIDARFPNYEDVIPSGNPTIVRVERTAFDQVLRRIMIVANEFTHDVRLQFGSGEVLISAHNTEQEEAEESISVEYDGPALEVGFNARYLRDTLNVMGASYVHMALKDALSPILVMEEGNDVSRYVVMPMRI